MDFKRILVTDSLAWEIFGAAARDRLLFVRAAGDEPRPSRRKLISQRALSLIILFDRLVIHDFSKGVLRLPDLEKEGIVEVVAAHETPQRPKALSTRWEKGHLGSRGRPPKELLRSLAVVEQFRPLVVNRILTVRSDYDSFVADALHMSRRKYLNLFLDYAIAYIQGNEESLQQHVFTEAFPEDLRREITEELFDFSAQGERLSPTNATLVAAILFAEEIATIQHLSTNLGLGVATEHYGEKFRVEPSLTSREIDAVVAANYFVILRAALAEDRFMPRIEGLRQALSLRKDAHLKAIREQLTVFHAALLAGDRSVVAEAKREVESARRKLQRRAGWDRPLAWLAYLSVPAVVADVFLGTPIASLSLSAIHATGTLVSRRLEKENEWVLFGT
jgi:hypothetical protein